MLLDSLKHTRDHEAQAPSIEPITFWFVRSGNDAEKVPP